MEKEGVFISHITEESALGTLVKGLLRNTFGDLKVFLSSDHESIGSGDGYFDKILSELKSSESIIVLLSKESMYRPWINFEAGVGKGAEALVVPALVRGLTKAEVMPPLSHVQLRDFEDPDDVLGALKDIAKKLNKDRNEVDVQGFVTELKSTGSTLPAKEVSLTPYIERDSSTGYRLRFALVNTGNQNIDLSCLEAHVPRSVVPPNWRPPDPVVIGRTDVQKNGIPYLGLRYTTYQGPPSSGYAHTETLPSFLSTQTRLELKPFRFPIKSSLVDEEKSLPIYYRIVARNANFPLQTTTLEDLMNQLAVSEKSPQTAKLAEAPRSEQPQSRRRIIGSFLI